MNKFQQYLGEELDDDLNFRCSDGFMQLQKQLRSNCKTTKDFEAAFNLKKELPS